MVGVLVCGLLTHSARGCIVCLFHGLHSSGEYNHARAFTHNYTALPRVGLGHDDTHIDICLKIRNDFHKPMDVMYMCHVNFRIKEGAEIVCTAPSSPDTFKVRSTFPDHVSPSDEHIAFLEAIATDPDVVSTMTPEVQRSAVLCSRPP